MNYKPAYNVYWPAERWQYILREVGNAHLMTFLNGLWLHDQENDYKKSQPHDLFKLTFDVGVREWVKGL